MTLNARNCVNLFILIFEVKICRAMYINCTHMVSSCRLDWLMHLRIQVHVRNGGMLVWCWDAIDTSAVVCQGWQGDDDGACWRWARHWSAVWWWSGWASLQWGAIIRASLLSIAHSNQFSCSMLLFVYCMWLSLHTSARVLWLAVVLKQCLCIVSTLATLNKC